MKFTREQVLQLAEQAGFTSDDAACMAHDIARLCTLAADAALEAAAKVVEPSPDHRMRPQDYLGEHQGLEMCDNLAEAIRAMKDKP